MYALVGQSIQMNINYNEYEYKMTITVLQWHKI